MSVGKMNQLFKNEGFLTPEKRCSKGPKQYRYKYPKNFKVFSKFYQENQIVCGLFPENSPFVPEICEPRPQSSYPNYQIYSYDKFYGTEDYRLSNSIRSAKEFLTESKKKRGEAKEKLIIKSQKTTSRAIASLQKNIRVINELAEDLCCLKEAVREKMAISELY